MHCSLSVFIFLATLLSGAGVSAQFCRFARWTTPVSRCSGGTCGVGNSLTVGDVNGDGVPDVLSVSDNPGFGEGRGWLFDGATRTLLREITPPRLGIDFGVSGSFLGDIDGDGRDDFAIGAQRDGPGAIYVYSGGQPLLPPRVVPGEPGDAFFGSLVAAGGDLTGDGIPDLLSVKDFPTRLIAVDSVSLQRAWSVPLQVLGRFAVIGDVNGDGRADVAASTNPPQVLSGLDGSPLYAFTLPPANGTSRPPYVGLDDIDGDGVPDFASAVDTATGTSFRAGVVRLYSGASGARIVDFAGHVMNGALGLELGVGTDITGDGVRELVAGGVDLFRVFDPVTRTIVGGVDQQPGGQWWRVAIADFDRDGLGDVVIGDQGVDLLPGSGVSGAIELWSSNDDPFFDIDSRPPARVELEVGENLFRQIISFPPSCSQGLITLSNPIAPNGWANVGPLPQTGSSSVRTSAVWTPQIGDVGVHPVRYEVTDGQGRTAVLDFEIVVAAPDIESVGLGGVGATGCQGGAEPWRLSDGSEATAEVDYVYDATTSSLEVRVRNTSTAAAGGFAPVISDLWLNLPEDAVLAAQLIDQQTASGSNTDFAFSWDPQRRGPSALNTADCFGDFSIHLSAGSSGAIASVGQPVSTSVGAVTADEMRFTIRLNTDGLLGAAAFPRTLSVWPRQVPHAGAAVRFVGGGAQGVGQGIVGPVDECRTAVHTVGVPQVGGQFTLRVTGSVGCYSEIWWSGDRGATPVAGMTVSLALPILATTELGIIGRTTTIDAPISIPADPALAGTTLHLSSIGFRSGRGFALDLQASPSLELVIRP